MDMVRCVYVDRFNGDAADAMIIANNPAGVANGMKFSTTDVDNSICASYDSSTRCPSETGGGWWYNCCCSACLTASNFSSWYFSVDYHVQTSRMMLKLQ